MKKSSTEDENSEKPHRKDGHSSQSRLYRASVQLAQRLDIQIRSVTDWQELFQAETISVRQRLRSQCEQLMFNHAKEYGRKTEELLWRKVFYDVIQMLRQQRKAIGVDEALDSAFRTHLVSASGYYHHLLLQLQFRHKVQLDGIVSWGHAKARPSVGSLDNGADAEVQEWAIKACQRCLICLGDLARYQQDVDGEQNATLAKRFYCEAVLVDPHLGMPHNQLGTLCSNQFYGCEGAYYYMRCLLSKHVFEGAEGNLLRLFERNRSALQRIKELPAHASEKDRVRRFLVYFLHLQDVLYGHESSPKVSSEDVGQLCQSVLQDLSAALITQPSPPEPNTVSNSGGAVLTNGDLGDVTSAAEKPDGIITSSLMVKLVTMAMMAVTMLKDKGSPQTSVAAAFNLAFLSQLLQHCISCLEHPERYPSSHSVMAVQKFLPVENGLWAGKCNGSQEDHSKLHKVQKIKKALKHRRRRRRQMSGDNSFGSESGSDLERHSLDPNDNDSDLSEGGEVDDINEDELTSEEDSEDVYVESESEPEGDLHNSAPRTLLFTSNGGKDCLKEAGKLLSQQVGNKQAWNSGLMKQNGFVFNRVTRADQPSDVSDAETESSVASSVLTTLSMDLKECPESTLLKAVVRDKLLPSVKVLTDWLRVNPDIITTCVESSSALLYRVASLLNILPSPEQISSAVSGSNLSLWRNLFEESVDADWIQTRVLPEDICLLGFAPLADLHKKLDLKWNRPPKDSKYLEAAVRIQCLASFGKQLASIEALETFNWDENTQKFIGPRHVPVKDKPSKLKNDTVPKPTTSQTPERRARVMKAMAQQKLQSDVADLEHTLKKTQPKSSTAYLVPDAPALCTQLHLIMRLVGSEKFLLLIPLQVIAALDELKKYDSGAREAIKYLEGQFKRGNRWVRAQKEGEAMVEDNKKRGRYEDVAVWRFNQVVSCCRFVVNEAGRGLVTLLTGSGSYDAPSRGRKRAVKASGTQATPEAVEFARRCGVNVESLRVFCTRFSSVKAVT